MRTHTIGGRLALTACAVAVVAAACSNGGSPVAVEESTPATTAAPTPEPAPQPDIEPVGAKPNIPTTDAATSPPPTKPEPEPDQAEHTVELVEVTLDDINVTAVVPAGWEQHGTLFAGDQVVLAFDVEDVDNSLDPLEIGFEQVGSWTAGGHDWEVFAVEGDGWTVYAAGIEVGESIYSIAVSSPTEEIDRWVDAVLVPAMESFDAGPPPRLDMYLRGRPDPGEDLGAALDAVVDTTPVPAIGVAVFDGDEIIESAVAGVRRSGDPTPVELDDTFSIGSNAKAMTATVVASLVDEGVLSWDTTVAEIYGDVLSNIDETMGDVTIRQLLTHTAGLDDLAAGFEWIVLEGFADDRSPVEQRAEVSGMALTQPAQQPAGIHLYSNIGYIVVGALLDEVTGTSWEELVQTRVFDPLGMDSCGFFAPGTPGQVDQPWGHLDEADGRAVDPGAPDAEMGRVVAPAGLIHCSMADYATFLRFQLRGFQGSDTEILSAAAFEAMRTPARGSVYALGWGVIPRSDDSFVATHDGSNKRFTARAVLLPGDDIGFLVVTNLGEAMAGPAVDQASELIATRYTVDGND